MGRVPDGDGGIKELIGRISRQGALNLRPVQGCIGEGVEGPATNELPAPAESTVVDPGPRLAELLPLKGGGECLVGPSGCSDWPPPLQKTWVMPGRP